MEENIIYKEADKNPKEPFQLTEGQTRDLIIEGMLAGMITTGGSDYQPPILKPIDNLDDDSIERLV